MNQLTPSVRKELRHPKSKKGQTLVEYALVLSFISVLSIIVMSAMGVEIRGLYLPIIDALQSVQQSIQ
jgi:Flp pilus assembly pilin Flp